MNSIQTSIRSYCERCCLSANCLSTRKAAVAFVGRDRCLLCQLTITRSAVAGWQTKLRLKSFRTPM